MRRVARYETGSYIYHLYGGMSAIIREHTHTYIYIMIIIVIHIYELHYRAIIIIIIIIKRYDDGNG